MVMKEEKMMGWNQTCFKELDQKGMFENSGHRTRFKELLDCYGNYPFFSRGLCKCMYLSAWDEEHFVILLEVLMEMALGKEQDDRDMKEQGDALVKEHTDAENQVYRLSCAFLENESYVPDNSQELPEEIRYIIRRAMEAAEIIDSI